MTESVSEPKNIILGESYYVFVIVFSFKSTIHAKLSSQKSEFKKQRKKRRKNGETK